MKRWATLGMILLVLAAGGCTRVGSGPPSGKPHLVLVALDGCGPDVPGLAASQLAREGVTFDRACAASDEALYGEGALDSGRYPSEIAPLVRAIFRLPADTPTLPKVLSIYGYREAGFYGEEDLSGARGFAVGFTSWTRGERGGTLADLEPAVAAWLERSVPGGAPVFVSVAADEGTPAGAPAGRGAASQASGAPAGRGAASQASGAPAGRGADVSAGLERLAADLARVGMTAANTTVVITAASAPAAPVRAADAMAALRVPLVIWGSAVDEAHRGRHSDALVRTVDVLPTLLGVAGVTIPADVRGRDLRPELAAASASGGTASPTVSASPAAPPTACAEGDHYAALLRDDGSALLVRGAPAGSPRMMKRLAHPEAVDAAGPGAADRAALCAALSQVEKRSVAVQQAYRVRLDPRLKKSLQAHGYW